MSRAISKSGPKQINNVQGSDRLVVVEPDGSIALSSEAIFPADPQNDPRDYTLTLAAIRTPPSTTGNEYPRNVMRDIGFKFDDGSETALVGIQGCILNYNQARIDAGMRSPKASGRPFASQYGVTTITLGIPDARYTRIAEKLQQVYKIRLDSTAESRQGGFVWMEGSVNGVPRNESIDCTSDSFFEHYSRQVFYIKKVVENKKAVIKPFAFAPFIHVLQQVGTSISGVFFGNLRIKATLERPDDKVKYRLGFSIHHLQIVKATAIHAPELTAKSSTSLFAPNAFPDAAMDAAIQRILEGEEGEDENQDEEEDEEEDEDEEENAEAEESEQDDEEEDAQDDAEDQAAEDEPNKSRKGSPKANSITV